MYIYLEQVIIFLFGSHLWPPSQFVTPHHFNSALHGLYPMAFNNRLFKLAGSCAYSYSGNSFDTKATWTLHLHLDKTFVRHQMSPRSKLIFTNSTNKTFNLIWHQGPMNCSLAPRQDLQTDNFFKEALFCNRKALCFSDESPNICAGFQGVLMWNKVLFWCLIDDLNSLSFIYDAQLCRFLKWSYILSHFIVKHTYINIKPSHYFFTPYQPRVRTLFRSCLKSIWTN